MRDASWFQRYSERQVQYAGLYLFGICMLSFCNISVSFGSRFFLYYHGPLPEISALYVNFHYLLTALAIGWLLSGVWAYFSFKRALIFIYYLALIQLVASAYAWTSTLYFLAGRNSS